MAKYSSKVATGATVMSSHASFFNVLKASIPKCVMDAIGGSIEVDDEDAKETRNLGDAPWQGPDSPDEKDQSTSDPDPVRELKELEEELANGDGEEGDDESVGSLDPFCRPILGQANLRDTVSKLLLDLAKNLTSETMAAFV